MTVILGVALISGGIKGFLDNLFKPRSRPLREHSPLIVKGGKRARSIQ